MKHLQTLSVGVGKIVHCIEHKGDFFVIAQDELEVRRVKQRERASFHFLVKIDPMGIDTKIGYIDPLVALPNFAVDAKRVDPNEDLRIWYPAGNRVFQVSSGYAVRYPAIEEAYVVPHNAFRGHHRDYNYASGDRFVVMSGARRRDLLPMLLGKTKCAEYSKPGKERFHLFIFDRSKHSLSVLRLPVNPVQILLSSDEMRVLVCGRTRAMLVDIE